MKYKFSPYSRGGKGMLVLVILLVAIIITGVTVGVLVLTSKPEEKIEVESKSWQKTYTLNSYKTGENMFDSIDSDSGLKILAEDLLDQNSFVRFKITYTMSDDSNYALNKYLYNMFSNLTFKSDNQGYNFAYYEDGYYYLRTYESIPCTYGTVTSYFFKPIMLFDNGNVTIPTNSIELSATDYSQTINFTINFQSIMAEKYSSNANLDRYKNIHNYFLNNFSSTVLPIKVENGVLKEYVAPMVKNADGDMVEKDNVSFNLSSTYSIGEYKVDGICEYMEGLDLKIFEIADNTFKNKSNVSIIISPLKNITKIGEYAFYKCTKLSGNLEFYNCEINDYAFYSCKGLTNSTFFGDCKIGDNTFNSCGGILLLDLSNVSKIGQFSFANCNLVSSLIMGDNIDTVSFHAFDNCYNLVVVNFSKTKNITIETFAFYNCAKLWHSYDYSYLDITKATKIKSAAFSNCLLIEYIKVDSSYLPNYSSDWKSSCNASVIS